MANDKQSSPGVARLILEADRLTLAIRLLKGKPRLTDSDLRELARLKTDLLHVCPPARYDWVDGLPALDILKAFQQIEKET